MDDIDGRHKEYTFSAEVAKIMFLRVLADS
jgi:hypothetical protein